MTTVKEILTRGFLAVMSKGDDIRVDQDEIEAVVANAAAGRFIKVRGGIINPSYLVGIQEDKKRREIFLEDTKYDQGKRGLGMRPLKDIFAKEAPRIGGPPDEGGGRELPAPKQSP